MREINFHALENKTVSIIAHWLYGIYSYMAYRIIEILNKEAVAYR